MGGARDVVGCSDILFRDLFDTSAGSVAIMELERLLASPPAKFSEIGTNQLLTVYFWVVGAHLRMHLGVHPVDIRGGNVIVGNRWTWSAES